MLCHPLRDTGVHKAFPPPVNEANEMAARNVRPGLMNKVLGSFFRAFAALKRRFNPAKVSTLLCYILHDSYQGEKAFALRNPMENPGFRVKRKPLWNEILVMNRTTTVFRGEILHHTAGCMNVICKDHLFGSSGLRRFRVKGEIDGRESR